ncbi:TRASH domain-containing protein [Novosphingobium decolorationis]|uniref:TRASH domain-containing protein n=1 Tax=Novosphingobium decolorationis TaxID=2698673 RepID=A0ABX8EBE1_9SPHN|nr:TRASH domain-containing protein [Novosphingobium decolorationis]
MAGVPRLKVRNRVYLLCCST